MRRPGHVQALERDGALLADAVAATTWDASVPACPGWMVRDLVLHLGRVHRWAAAYVGGGSAERSDPDLLPVPTTDDELLAWFRDGHAALVRTLADAADDVECWQFMPHLGLAPVDFWARRQAHETAMHRVDAQQAAAARVTPFEPAFAVDGVHELLSGFLAQPRRRARLDVAAELLLRATDTGDTWHVRASGDDYAVAHVAADAAGRVAAPVTAPVTVSATASDLHLALWNRGDVVTVDGDAAAWDHWRRATAI